MPDPTNILGHGVDLIEVARIAGMIQRHGQQFLGRVFTAGEQQYAEGSKRRVEHYAARFAAKEAILKTLGTGWRDGIAWTDCEVVLLPSGAPTVRLHGRAAELATQAGMTGWFVSLSHTQAHAMASVIATGVRPQA